MSSPEPSLSRHESGPPESSAGAARFNGELSGGLNRGIEMIELLGMQLASCSEAQLLDTLFDALARQRGGWLITANLDFLRRFCRDERMQVLYSEADLRVADGMPLIWAAYLRGTPLPERIAGSSLIRPMAKRAAAERKPAFRAQPALALLRDVEGVLVAAPGAAARF
jgi:N-acetylglucosaminyldiphosphoundecaprenol N-acetyl-beta-D-mannosaminyltransferase